MCVCKGHKGQKYPSIKPNIPPHHHIKTASDFYIVQGKWPLFPRKCHLKPLETTENDGIIRGLVRGITAHPLEQYNQSKATQCKLVQPTQHNPSNPVQPKQSNPVQPGANQATQPSANQRNPCNTTQVTQCNQSKATKCNSTQPKQRNPVQISTNQANQCNPVQTSAT